MSLKDLKDFVWWLLTWGAVVFWAAAALDLTPLGRDDSDPGAWGPRSGVSVRTDALTGCQYLEGGRGGLIPRVDGAGRHVGRSEEHTSELQSHHDLVCRL